MPVNTNTYTIAACGLSAHACLLRLLCDPFPKFLELRVLPMLFCKMDILSCEINEYVQTMECMHLQTLLVESKLSIRSTVFGLWHILAVWDSRGFCASGDVS